MAFSGGVFSRVYSWVTDRINGIDITASRMDQEMDGFATGLSNCLLKDGTQTVTANIPMNSFKLTGLADPTASGDAVHLGYTASDTQSGVIEIATYAEVQAGADTTRAVVPGRLAVVPYFEGTQTAAANADIPIPAGSWRWIDIRLDGILVSTAGNLCGRISTDGGSSYISTSTYVIAASGVQSSGTTISAVSGAVAQMAFMPNIGTTSFGALTMRIPNPSSTNVRKPILFEGGYITGSEFVHMNGMAEYNGGNDDITHIRFFNTAGGTVAFTYLVLAWR